MKASEGKKKTTIKYTAQIIDENGNVIESTSSDPIDIPAMEDFDLSTKEGFLQDFDSFEHAVIQARDQVTKDIANEYFDSASKKNQTENPRKKRPQ